MTMAALCDFLSGTLWWWFAPAVSIVVTFIGLAIYKQQAVIAVTPFIYTLF